MTRASSPCSTPGCPHLKPCPTHKPTPWKGSTRRHTLPAGWTATSKRILARDDHRCTVMVNGQRCNRPARQTDHIVRGAGDHDTNLAAICDDCHRAKTAAEANRARWQR